MKYHIRNSFLTPRALAASMAVVLTTSVPVLAQSGGAGSTSSTTNPNTPSSSSSTTGTNANQDARSNANNPTATPGTPYQSRAGGDVDSTIDINTRNAANMPARDKLSWGDRRFVNKAADSGHSELQLAELAAQRATNPEVKNFAQKLVTGHTKVNSELKSLASQKGLTLDTDTDQDRTYKRLAKKSGAEFDQEFVEQMIDEHEKDVKMFEKASDDARDPEVRSFASKHVGHLREHLQQAQSLRQAVMPTGRMDDSSGRSTSGGATGSPSTTSSGSTRSDTNYGTSGTSGTSSSGTTGTGSSSTSGSSTTGSGTSSGSSTTQPRR
jgi:putative membrane protein